MGGTLRTGSPPGTPRSSNREKRRHSSACMNIIPAREGRRTKSTEVNDFPVSSSVPLCFLCPLLGTRLKTRKTSSCGKSSRDKGAYWQHVFFLLVMSLLWHIRAAIVSIFILTMDHIGSMDYYLGVKRVMHFGLIMINPDNNHPPFSSRELTAKQ